jgi:UrcA family protein
MDAAARTVCGDRLASVHLAVDAQARECRANVIADIRNQIEARQAATTTGSRVQLASR